MISVLRKRSLGSKQPTAKQARSPQVPLEELIRVHQEALLEVADTTFPCRVCDHGAGTITLTAPLDERGLPLLLPRGTPVRVVLRCGHRFLGFETSLTEPRMADGIPVLDVRLTQAELTDRRSYFRVPVSLGLQYRLHDQETFDNGRVTDLSGGGFQGLFSRDFSAETGARLLVRIAIPTHSEQMEAMALLRRLFPRSSATPHRRGACEFVELTVGQRERLISYVTQRQIELIRAGLL